MMSQNRPNLPDMDGWTEEQIAEFWASHDSVDYWRDMQPVALKVRRQGAKQKELRLRLPSSQRRRLNRIALRMGTTPEVLVLRWIAEGLSKGE